MRHRSPAVVAVAAAVILAGVLLGLLRSGDVGDDGAGVVVTSNSFDAPLATAVLGYDGRGESIAGRTAYRDEASDQALWRTAPSATSRFRGYGDTANFARTTTHHSFRAPAPRSALPCNSFVPGTAVLMADGTTRRIEDVELGDLVWAADPETGEEGPREVTRLITRHGDKTLVEIEIDGERVTATDHHPIWVDNDGEWVDAEDLQPGDHLLDEDGVTLLVDDIDIRRVPNQTVYNLTVDDLHTFFVLAGDEAILTHNNNCPVPEPSPQYLPDGSPNRGPAAWVNAADESGTVTLHASSPGVHAEVAAQTARPGAQMSQVWGWRGPTASPGWRPIPICPNCQLRFPPSLFPPGTMPAPGGVWPQP